MKKLLLSLSLMLCSYLLWAQQSFTIKVTDAKTGNPVTNASATVRSTHKGTSADNNGMISLQGKANDVIEITSIGYNAKTITLSGSATISVLLEATSVDLGDIVVVGSRGAGRAKTETAVPVDVIKINQTGMSTGKTDLTSVLNMAAPSFNYNKQSGADGADHIDQGTLRGLGPDHTLVLINGKRRHQTAFVALFGTRGRANSGTDLNAFPEASIDRIEILRDGASAQYGSDAIGGVMNFILKKDINHWTVNAGWAGNYDNKFNPKGLNNGNQYYAGHKFDGSTFTASLDNGFKLGNRGGFVHVSIDYLNQGKTFRQVDTAHWQTDKNTLPYLNTSRRAFGDGSVESFGAMYNMEIPTSARKRTTFYSFGGYNNKFSDDYAYTRNYSGNPARFPADLNGNLIFNPDIMHVTTDGEIYYNPHIQTRIQDQSSSMGLKGKCHSWNWDLSNTFGRNDFHYYGDKTFNASMFMVPQAEIQTHFNDGGFNLIQNTINLDLSKSFSRIAQGLNLGLGAEWRYEHYQIYAGELASYTNFHPTDIYYPSAGGTLTPAGGSQGFPGFSPADEVKAHRSSVSVYVDGELNATKKWLLDGAIRFEDYTDFGAVATFKLATRYKIMDNLNVRGSISSGFRAPSLQQINFSNTLTSFSSGQLVQSRIVSNNDPLARAAGIPNLKQETSLNASLGFSWKPVKDLTFTVDGYMVKMKDRVVLSGLFHDNDPGLPVSFTSQFPADVKTVQFFANAANTTNYGVDVVADYSKKWGKQGFKALLAGNFQNMKIDAINVPGPLSSTQYLRKTFYSDREEAFLKASAPKLKFNLNLEYDYKKLSLGTHITYFGKISLMGFGTSTPENPYGTGINPVVPSDADASVLIPEVFDFKGKATIDLYTAYHFSKKVSIFAGVDNVFNVHPNLGINPLAKGYATDNESGGPWDSVQMGFNGMRVFGKIALTF